MANKKDINPRIDFYLKNDFDLVRKFYIKQADLLLESIRLASPKQLITISTKAFNLQNYINDMFFFGYPNIAFDLEKDLLRVFGTKNVLKNIQKKALLLATKNISGQYSIGCNEFIIRQSVAYHRNIFGDWYTVPVEEINSLLPQGNKLRNHTIIKNLEKSYKLTILDKVFMSWQRKKWRKSIDDTEMIIKNKVTTPEDFFQETTKQIQSIINNPISFKAIEKNHLKTIQPLEKLIKVCFYAIQFIYKLRKKRSNIVYILRDGLIFAETHKILDLLLNKSTLSNRLMLAKNCFQNKKNITSKYWSPMVDVFYSAFRKSPDSFKCFYIKYTEEMQKREKQNLNLHQHLKKLSGYIRQNINRHFVDKKNIVIVDTGLQGSIAMLLKYLIDVYLLPQKNIKINTDICLFTTGEWLKKIYHKRYGSDYYPFMRDIEIFSRSNNLYSYLPKSFNKGKIHVYMGEKKHQILASIELIILISLCINYLEVNKSGGII